MNSLEVTIGGQRFDHMVYHFVLTYSNWESITICFSESFESLSEGIQNAVWQLGGVPQRHRTDRMSLAVNNGSDLKEFTERYTGLLGYYGMEMEKIQPREANENGNVEQSHRRFKKRWSRRCCFVAAETSRTVKPMVDSCKSWWRLAMQATARGWMKNCLGSGVCRIGGGRATSGSR